MSTLDLSGADLKGFEPVPAGAYACTVYEASMGEVSGQGKLPAGTPKLQVTFLVSEGEFAGKRRFWGNYAIPPADYEKAPQLKGMLVRFLTALGYDEKKLISGKFNLDVEDIVGRECVVTVKVEPRYGGEEGEMTNTVTGVKPAGSSTAGSGGSKLT
jgi:hypothetical protein